MTRFQCCKKVREVTRHENFTPVLLYSLIVLFLFSDSNLMAPNLTAIADSFNMTHVERDVKVVGYTNLVFNLVGAATTLVVGYLADRYERRTLFTLVVLIAAFACLLTILVYTYEELLACRAFVAIGLGGVLPIIYSFIGDEFSSNTRGRMCAMVGVSCLSTTHPVSLSLSLCVKF